MKIYHTETQSDYDALMIKLEEQGCKWLSGNKPTSWNDWSFFGKETCVRLDDDTITQSFKSFYDGGTPITKYKAEAEVPIKFTKENVYRLFGDYRRNKNGIHRLDDLESAIMDLDDTPEKVVVPKFVADEIAELGEKFLTLRDVYDGNVDFLCQGTNFLNGEELKLARWVNENGTKFERAWLNGYTIEKEVLYYIPLPHLKTTDGIQQVLTKRSKNGRHYFASRPNEKLKQRYTKAELEQVPEVYKPYATLIEEEEK